MATGQTGGTLYAPPAPAAPKDQPGRAPTGPAPLKPALTHLEQPHPVLQAAGFQGGIQAFNDKVDQIVQAHQQAYGTTPTPGLTLDVAKSTADPAQLFKVPLSPIVAKAAGTLAVHKQQNPDDYFQTNANGMLEPVTPLTRMINQVVAHPVAPDNLAAPQALKHQVTGADLQKQHPWVPVQAGFLPIDNFGELVNAFSKLEAGGGATANLEGGQTLAQFENAVGIGTEPGGKPRGGIYKMSAQAMQSGYIDTVKKAQEELKQNYPAFYAGLDPTGNFDAGWIKATASFQSSATYYQAATKRLASDNHFDTTGAFIKAWKLKQSLLARHDNTYQFLQHQPLAFFGNGKSVINFLDGDTHGWGFANLPTVGLHTLVGVGHAVFDESAALSGEAKAQFAAMVDFYNRVGPVYLGGRGETVKEAWDHSHKVLRENPTWLRVFYPDLPAHPTGVLAAVDGATNLAGDIFLGNKLVIGGAAVDIGDSAGLASHRYFKGATQLAFNSLKKEGIDGVGAASKVLQGGEGLNVAVADGIKNGDVTLAQYRGHVSDLYHHGRTRLPASVAHPELTAKVYHGTSQTFDKFAFERANKDALYGPGFYHTDNVEVAGGYAQPSRDASDPYEQMLAEKDAPQIRPAYLDVRNPLDVATEVPADTQEKLRQITGADAHVVSGFKTGIKTGQDLYQFIAKTWGKKRAVGILEELGYDGITQTGGHLVGGGIEHKVTIAFRAEQVHAAPEIEAGLPVLHVADTPGNTVLRSLRTKELPNKMLARDKVKAALDQYDSGLRNSGLKGTTNAANMWSSARVLISRAAPGNEARRIYDAKTPDDVFNWVVRNLNDRELAYKARNDFVVARAKEDIPAIKDLNQSLLERYAAENPNVKGKPSPLDESGGPEVEAESRSSFNFISGRQKDPTNVFDRLQQRSQRINSKLLSAARVHRQVIISGWPLPGGESLFWKHAVADTLRRFAGGGGLDFKLNEAQKAARTDVTAFFKDNPAALREHSAQRASAEMGEVAWLTRNRPEQYLNFNTGDHLTDAKKMEGAGAYLRHMVTDDALNAYRASTKADRKPLFRHVWHSSFYQNLIAKSEDFQHDAGLIKAQNLAPDQQTRLLSELKKSYAQDWTDALWQRYRAVDDAGTTANVENALELAAQVAREHPGSKIDTALGKFITDSKLAFDVKDAPIKGTGFDTWMSKWTSKLLTFNKLNRRTFYDNIFYDTYHELSAAGWEKADAVGTASDLAKAQTIYHMLDFSNMLQIEQNLRWLSYYATKHRLYWSWIARTFAKKPLLAAAVSDIGNALDAKGNLNVTIHGHRLAIPATRLVWANNTEYPETSPIVQAGVEFGANLFKGQSAGNAIANAFAAETATSGNVFTRQDQGIALLGKYVGMLSGKTPATFGLAVDGMSPVQRAVFNEEMHGYILSFRAAHDGRYPSEADAVKATLLRTTGNEVWRTNLFLPVLPQSGKPTAIQQEITAFGNISNPAKRRDFLLKHPEIQDYFGASQDQDVFLHEQPLWDQFNAISKQRDLDLRKVRLAIDQHGYTTGLAAEVKGISAKYSKAIQDLRSQDALTWKGSSVLDPKTGKPLYPAGRLADNGEIQVEGPWSKKLDGDPIAAKAFLHESFPDISKGQLDAHTIGQTAVDLQNEATRIHQLGWQKLGYPDEQHAKDRLSQITQTLDVFRSMPKNPTSQMVDSYYSQYVDPYMKMRDKLTVEQAKTSSEDKNVVYSLNRAIKEHYDHPVVVIDPVNGKKTTFPSPVSFGFTMLPPDQYHAALAGAVASRWQDITGYEKTLLGIKTPPHVADGWAAYQKTVADYRAATPGATLIAVQKAGLARQIDKQYPGFYKDFLFASQAKVDRYERTNLYQGLAKPLRATFDQLIGGPAKQLVAAIKANGHSSYYMGYWRQYVKGELATELEAHPELKSELQQYGPDFLNTLPSH